MTTKLADNRDLALVIGYEATDWSQNVSFAEYKQAMETWRVRLLERDNLPIGAVYNKDDELHISVLPDWRKKWLTKGLYKQLFAGKVTTKVTPGHEYMYEILTRIGFVKHGDIFIKE